MQIPSPPPSSGQPAETVLWSGKPDPAGIRALGLARVRPIRLAACGVALVALFIAVRLDVDNWGSRATIPLIVTAVAAIVAALATAWPLFLSVKARKTTYAVTDRHLVIEERFFRIRRRTFAAEQLVPLRIVERSPDSGDVYFAVDSELVGHPSCGCGAGLCPTPSGKISRITDVLDRKIENPIGFIGISDPQGVASLVTAQFGIPRATDLH